MWFKVLNKSNVWIASVYGKDLHEAFQNAQGVGGILIFHHKIIKGLGS